MENLKALVYGQSLTNYQLMLAQREFEELIKELQRERKEVEALKEELDNC